MTPKELAWKYLQQANLNYIWAKTSYRKLMNFVEEEERALKRSRLAYNNALLEYARNYCDKALVHYGGSTKFFYQLFNPISNDVYDDGTHGGYHTVWVTENTICPPKENLDPKNHGTICVFELKPEAKIRTLKYPDEVLLEDEVQAGRIDYERLAEGYDILDIRVDKQHINSCNLSHDIMYDTVIVVNPEVIEQIRV